MAQFLNSPADCKWLKQVHLSPRSAKFRSFILEGNEDCPERVILYKTKEARIDEMPVEIYNYNESSNRLEVE